jgi:HAD superfamily hydrolase (TIGR01458 family)
VAGFGAGHFFDAEDRQSRFVAAMLIRVNAVDAVLIDIAGVLHVGDVAVSAAPEALQRLRDRGLPLRFLTNTTRRTRERLAQDLCAMGLDVAVEEIVTAASAAHDYITRHGLHPHLLLHPGIEPAFRDLADGVPDCVLLGDAADGFSYAALDHCFRLLMDDPARPLIAMARNRYFRDGEGLHLDMGAFVSALEYASGRQAIITGKPAPAFFDAALSTLGVSPQRAVMIGDDVEADIAGAVAVGMQGVLVRTGKFQPADELSASKLGAATVDDFAAAVERVLSA